MGELTTLRSGVFWASLFAGCMNSVVVGNLAGWSQAAIPQLISRHGFTDAEVAWIAGFFYPGMLMGGILALTVTARFGKCCLFRLAMVTLIVGWSGIAMATSYWAFFWSRLFLGLSGGMINYQTEMYLSEISPPRLRSRLSILICVSFHTGILEIFAIGPLMTLSQATGIYLVKACLLLILYLFVTPETPFWLLRRGRANEALESLRTLRGRADVHEEFAGIREFVEQSIQASVKSEGTLASMKRVISNRANAKAILVVFLLTIAQHFSGMSAMHVYTQLIFERSVTAIPGHYVSFLVGMIELFCVVVSGFLVESIGRRPLVFFSVGSCGVCMALLGFCFGGFLTGNIIPLVCIVSFSISYALGLTSMPTIIASECISMDARNLCVVVQTTSTCTSLFFILKLWQVIASQFGQEYSFWMSALFMAILLPILIAIQPETKGKSLMEIQEILSGVKSDSRTTQSAQAFNDSALILPEKLKVTIVPRAESG